MNWWNLNPKTESKKDYLARVKYEEIVCKKANHFMQIVDGDLLPNVQYRIITENSFNAISVIEYLSKYNDLIEIYIAVYRMNQQAVNKLTTFINDENISCNILLSSFFRENKKYEKWCADLISLGQGKKNVNVCFAWNHAKVFIAKTKENRHIVFEGSGNLSDNARIEQYIIEDNKFTYDFHKEWMNDLIKSK
jgi:hypothetical protein